MDPFLIIGVIVAIAIVVVILVALFIARHPPPPTPPPVKYGVVLYVEAENYEEEASINGVSQVVDTFNFTRRVPFEEAKVKDTLQDLQREGYAASNMMVVGGTNTTNSFDLYRWVQASAPGVFVASPGMTAHFDPETYPYLVRILPSTDNEVTASIFAIVGRLGRPDIRPAIIRGRTANPSFEGVYQEEFIRQMIGQNPEWVVPVIPLDEWVAGVRPEGYDSLVTVVDDAEMNEVYPTLPDSTSETAIPIIATSILSTYQPTVTVSPSKHVFITTPTVNSYTVTTNLVYKEIIRRGGSDATFPISVSAYNTYDFLAHLQTILDDKEGISWESFEDRDDAAIPPAGTLGSWYDKRMGGQFLGMYNVTALYTPLTPEEVRTLRQESEGYPGLPTSNNDIYQIGSQFSNGNVVQTFTLNTLDTYTINEEDVATKVSYQQKKNILNAGTLTPSFYTVPVQQMGEMYSVTPFSDDVTAMRAYPIETTTQAIKPYDCFAAAAAALRKAAGVTNCELFSLIALSTYSAGPPPTNMCGPESANPWYIYFKDSTLNPPGQPPLDTTSLQGVDWQWVVALPTPSQTAFMSLSVSSIPMTNQSTWSFDGVSVSVDYNPNTSVMCT